MHGEDSFGAGSDGRLDLRRVKVESDGINVHEHGPGSHVQRGVSRSDESKGRGDHLVAGADAVGQQSYVQGRGPRRSSYGMFHSAESGKGLLELGHTGTLSQHPGIEHGQHSLFFLLTHHGFGDGYHLAASQISWGTTVSHWQTGQHILTPPSSFSSSCKRRPQGQTKPRSRAGLPITRP